MSDSESEDFQFADSDDGSAFDASPQPKKKAAAKPKALTAAKPKAAAKPKPAAAKRKEALKPKNNNLPMSDSAGEENSMLFDDTDVPPPPKKAAAPAGAKKSASETYQKLSQIEHVLKRPDTYIGSVEPIKDIMWVYDKEKENMVNRYITFVPGLYKIVDEILVNAADNKQRDGSMDLLKVTVNAEKNFISVMNNGAGIPIEMHSKEGCYVPELIFGHLLAGSNFDDDEKKTTGGRNGYGAKLANIYSTEFIVETASKESGKKYKQTFRNNMSQKDKPKITDYKKGDDYTKITFSPDLAKFNLPPSGLAGDMEALLCKRVYDMAGTLRDVKVYLNDERIKLAGFKRYVQMYTSGINEAAKGGATAGAALGSPGSAGADSKATIHYERCGERWEIAFTPSDGQFQQVSFCNSIATTKGGTHVEYVVKQLVDKVVEFTKKKHAKTTLKPFQVRNYLWVFVNCLVENPAFDSQTKEHMTLGVSKFGSKCSVSEGFLKKVLSSGVVDKIVSFAKYKEEAALKKTDGSKRSRLTGIAKLEDANNAGSKNARNCTLILTEGDSAKSLAVSGLAVIGRDNYGVFPLRGKLLNVREASGVQLLNNVEIQHIKQILGLQQGKKYTSVDSLRYGSVMIMADQDHDGSHIKGLLINFFDHFFPSLLEIPGFLVEFITPIVKATKRGQEVSFFTLPQFQEWKEANNGARDWKTKYYKGLGTSFGPDVLQYFGSMNRHRLKFAPTHDGERALIDMVFNKKKADDRKEWLRTYQPGTYLDQNVSQITYSEFINKELILFSMADNVRSIPSVVDGFKPGQRKVLFACFKRRLRAELKVAQLGAYCAEHSSYHHDEVSLGQTIMGLAQNFVGSNNINLLSPNGQFGTRLQGGKDAASARYIFTNLEKVTRLIFHPADDNILSYLNDDGNSIEPEWYLPAVPMVLINGSSGIGTGWSSDIPNYNPAELVANLRRRMRGEDQEPMHPWYRGFRGVIEREGNKYKVLGQWKQLGERRWEITELPVGVWTQSYKEQLMGWVMGTDKIPALIDDYQELHTERTVHFIISLTTAGKEAVERDGFEKVFKMVGSLSITNMVCFDVAGKIKKYASPESILDDFYDHRLTQYQKRKEYLVEDLTLQHERLSNQARFVLMIIQGELSVSNRKKADVVAELRKRDFRPFAKKLKPKVAGDPDADNEDEEGDEDAGGAGSDYDYLLTMAISRLTAEQVAKLLVERDNKTAELNLLLGKSAKDLWNEDLDAFLEEWQAILDGDDEVQRSIGRAGQAKGKQTKLKKLGGKIELDSDGEEIYKPKAAKKAAAKPKAPALAPKPEPKAEEVDAGEALQPIGKGKKRASSEDEEEKPAKKPAPKKAKKALVEPDSDDDVFTVAKPKAPAAKAAGKPKKAPAKKAAKGGDSDDGGTVLGAAKAKKAPARKAAKSNGGGGGSDDDGSDDGAVLGAAKPKKGRAKPRPPTSDDDDASASPPPPPPKRAARAKAVAAPQYVDLTSESGPDPNGDDSFRMDDDDD